MDTNTRQVTEAAVAVTHGRDSETGDGVDDSNRKTENRGRIGKKGASATSILYSANVDRPPKSRTSKQPGTVRNVVYYQNRFIILDPPEAKSRSNTSSERSSELLQARGAEQQPTDDTVRKSEIQNSADGEDAQEIPEKFRHKIKHVSVNALAKKSKMEMDASSVTMDARGIEIIVTDSDSGFRSRNTETNKTMWKKISQILLDNRMKGRAGPGRVLNSEHPEEYRVLKKVLNIIFLTIGITLLISVIIVIIYTTVGKYQTYVRFHTNIHVRLI